MSLLPNELTGKSNLFNNLVGGALGAIYGAKNGNFMDGVLGGYYGMNNPNGLFEKLTNNLFNPKPQQTPMQPPNNLERGF